MNKCFSVLLAMVLLALFTGCACVCPKTEANAVTPPVADTKASTAVDTTKTSVAVPAMDSAKKEVKADTVQSLSAPADSSKATAVSPAPPVGAKKEIKPDSTRAVENKAVTPSVQTADSLKKATQSTPADTSKQAGVVVQKVPAATDSVKAVKGTVTADSAKKEKTAPVKTDSKQKK
ncbi:MAG: hypothetical protein V1913_11615 [Fibrobacterota bacterium]